MSIKFFGIFVSLVLITSCSSNNTIVTPSVPSNPQYDGSIDPRVSDRFENIDADRNNIINFSEFYNHQTKTFLKPTEAQSGQTFLKYDNDRVGSYRLSTWTREEHGKWYSELYNNLF